jgi:hypothetical protein
MGADKQQRGRWRLGQQAPAGTEGHCLAWSERQGRRQSEHELRRYEMVVQDAEPETPVPEAAGETGKVLFGTQGFNNAEWTDMVYPRGLPPKPRLAHYARMFDLVEIDYT